MSFGTTPNKGRTTNVPIRKVGPGGTSSTFDDLVTEEPLEIRVYYHDPEGKEAHQSVSTTMRTPGNDFELSAGFLFAEGVLSSRDDIDRISYCVDVEEEQQYNIVNVYLAQSVSFDPGKLSRYFYASSSCGVCGKASLEAIHTRGCPVITGDRLTVSEEVVTSLPERLRAAQNIFNKTGGLHAAGLFDSSGKLEVLREDVGRHNAVDKLVGSQLLKGRVPLNDRICTVSGRIGFELVQKSLAAGIPMMVAVGAPSSLSVELASDFKMTLIGFVRGKGFNIYSGAQRVVPPVARVEVGN